METAAKILDPQGLYKEERGLRSKNNDSLLKLDMRYGDHFVNGDVKNSNNQFENIGAYLMKDGKRGNIIMAARR